MEMMMEYLHSLFTLAVPAKLWQVLLLLLVVINLKNMPLVWHVSVISLPSFIAS